MSDHKAQPSTIQSMPGQQPAQTLSLPVRAQKRHRRESKSPGMIQTVGGAMMFAGFAAVGLLCLYLFDRNDPISPSIIWSKASWWITMIPVGAALWLIGRLIPSASPPAPSRAQSVDWRGRAVTLTCPACGGMMQKTSHSSGNVSGILIGLILLGSGIIVFIAIPIAGWIIGPAMILLGLGCGGKTQKIWRCRSCGHFLQRL